MEQAQALRRGRPLQHRQQRAGERHPAVLCRSPQLAVRRHGAWRQRQRQPVLAAADLPGQQHRRLPLPSRAVRCAAQRADRRRLRRAAALVHRPQQGLNLTCLIASGETRTRLIDRIL